MPRPSEPAARDLVFDPVEPLSAGFRDAVGERLRAFIDERSRALEATQPQIEPLFELARAFTAGGKRLRPAFCAWGWLAAAPAPSDPAPLLRAAASLDLLHVSALMHDDVMDDSDTRRGLAAAHQQYARLHRERGGRGDAAAFGRAGAILLGDLLLMWSAEMFDACGLPEPALAAARPLLAAMRAEVTCGQFLDVTAQTIPIDDPAAALSDIARVVEYKSARYSVLRPVQIGAALAGAGADVLDSLGAFALPIGIAFQYRDDVLGVFGDERLTGKPSGDDLREGKRTVLVAHTLAGLDAASRDRFDAMLGDPDLDESQVALARGMIEASGALAAVEAMITENYESGMAELAAAPIDDRGRAGLAALARAAVLRDF